MPDESRRQRTLPSWLLPPPARADERAGPPLREFTLRLMRGEDLRREEAAALLEALLDGAATDAQIGAALVALAVKGETVEELAGLASAMRRRAVRIRARHGRFVCLTKPKEGRRCRRGCCRRLRAGMSVRGRRCASSRCA